MTTSNTELAAQFRAVAERLAGVFTRGDLESCELAAGLLRQAADAVESKAEPVAQPTAAMLATFKAAFEGGSIWTTRVNHGLSEVFRVHQLYTAPVQPEKDERKPLSADEIEHIRARWDQNIHGDRTKFIVRETEAAHRIGIGSSTEGGGT